MFEFSFVRIRTCEFFNILWITMKINNSIEIKIKMHTESRNHTSSQAEMREHIFIPGKENEKNAFEDMIEDHFLEEEMLNSQLEEHFLEEKPLNSIENHFLEADMPEDHFLEDESLNSLIEEYLLKEDIRDSIIEEQALEAEMFNSLIEESILETAFYAERFNSLVEERIQEYVDLYDAIEGFEEDDCDYGPDYSDYHYENEIGIDLALYSPQFEYDDSEDSSCCFEIGYYNDENSTGIFGGYVDMYHPEFVPSFRHINHF